MSDFTVAEIVNKLVGPIEPVGDSSIDPQRCRNIQNLSYLILLLNEQLFNVWKYNKSSYEQSVKDCVKAVEDHYKELFEWLPREEELND